VVCADARASVPFSEALGAVRYNNMLDVARERTDQPAFAIEQFACLVFDSAISINTQNRGITMNIYVGNLPYSVTEDDLKEAFSEFGEVSSVTVISDKFSGQSKGFGFVEMPNNSEADAAIKALNESDFKGRNIKVNQAKPKGDRPQRGPRY